MVSFNLLVGIDGYPKKKTFEGIEGEVQKGGQEKEGQERRGHSRRIERG